MSYMKLEEFPHSVRSLIQKLSQQERNRLLYPHKNAVKGRQIQETIVQVLEASIKEGEAEESMLGRLRDYANTEWP